MKCHHPDVFCAALLNVQPMGFCAQTQIARRARALRAGAPGTRKRQPLGLHAGAPVRRRSRQGRAARPAHGQGVGQRTRRAAGDQAGHTSYGTVEEIWRRSGIPPAMLERLAEADAFRSIGVDRREAL